MGQARGFRGSNLFRLAVQFLFILGVIAGIGASGSDVSSKEVPLAEHPRPDLQRQAWLNLNGPWSFEFDGQNQGLGQGWQLGNTPFQKEIIVPFPWGASLSGVEDEADIGWYSRKISVPASWEGKRTFLVIGACDWRTTVWLDGRELGSHQGGYTPFEFELTPGVKYGKEQLLVLRVDDSKHEFKLEGKQGYGAARGVWQTVYLEQRGSFPLKTIHFSPDVDQEKVRVDLTLLEAAETDLQVELQFSNGEVGPVQHQLAAGESGATFEVALPEPHLWSLDDPFLYEVDVSVSGRNVVQDRVSTYFGMRKVSVVRLPGLDYPYVAINNEPVYLQMTLDQAYHPEGYYTFPSDAFMRDEILRSLKIGLNGMRIHVKIENPRKLYWADRLGMLIMADVPNSWGNPTPEMRAESETALKGMIERDYNHPSIFSWVIFNETWGLNTKGEGYLKETQDWVASMYHLAKQLDPTRLVEDNSPHREDHVVTDINSWHTYLPGYAWKEKLKEISDATYEGSEWNFVEGRSQGNEPLFNSECGNVWGYEGSAGDVDWSWDYHLMINEFRRHPKICGWLYTEHHDVINEWNGYYRYDRSEKETGLSDLVEGMSLRDLHSKIYVSPELDLCIDVVPGALVRVPLHMSAFMGETDLPEKLYLRTRLHGWDDVGNYRKLSEEVKPLRVQPWMFGELEPVVVRMPENPGLMVLSILVEDRSGRVLHRNFTSFRVKSTDRKPVEFRESDGKRLWLVRLAPENIVERRWSVKSWEVLNGLKVNGTGAGYFEYRIPWPAEFSENEILEAGLVAELSAKKLHGKDRDSEEEISGNFMLGKGTHDPSVNPNAYPMTDDSSYPSLVRVRLNGNMIGTQYLPDDPADHRGMLSWHAQPRDRHLREAGSYGYMVRMPIPRHVLAAAAREGELKLKFEVDAALPGGLAIYGQDFGRYPFDPTLVLVVQE